MEMIAHYVRNNIRELEGALNKVLAYSQLSGGEIGVDLVEMALADLVGMPDKLTLDEVIQATCDYYNVQMDDMLSASRKRTIAIPRHMVMYLARTETDASLPHIGNQLGNRDHTTIMYGYEKIASLAETDANTRRAIMEIKAALYESRTMVS
jgi:chromosomal replication initiator protein